MRVDPKWVGAGAAALLLMPLTWAADGQLRGTLPGGRQSLDPPEVQITSLPSGALVKRMPGQRPAGEASARLAAGVTLQQSGAAQLQVMPGSTAVATATRPAGSTLRQLGGAQLLEMPGQRSPGVPVAGAAAAAALPPGVQVVELAAQAPLPANPQPNTLYWRQP